MDTDRPHERTARVRAALLAGLNPAADDDARSRLEALTGGDWADFARIAIHNRMAPLLLHRLERRGLLELLDPQARTLLNDRRWQSAVRALRYRAEFKRLASVLTALGIRVVALKGMHLASAVFPSPELREMNDIDILIPRDRVREASDAVMSEGFTPMNDTPLDASLAVQHHLPRFLKAGVGLEVHWRLTASASDAETAALFARAQPLDAAPETWVLSAEDALLHVAVHGSETHLFEQGLRPIYDVAALIERHGGTLCWAAVLDRARDGRNTRALRLMLELAKRHAGAAVPPDVLGACGEETPPWLLELAIAICLGDELRTKDLSPTATRLLAKEPVMDRLRHVQRHVWCSAEELAAIYAVPTEHVRSRLLHYRFRRGWDLARTRGPRLLGVRLGGDAAERHSIDRRNQLATWLRRG